MEKSYAHQENLARCIHTLRASGGEVGARIAASLETGGEGVIRGLFPELYAPEPVKAAEPAPEVAPVVPVV